MIRVCFLGYYLEKDRHIVVLCRRQLAYYNHILREMIEIRDGFKECCILSKEDVSDIIDNLTVF